MLICACVISCGPPSWPGGIHAVLGASARGVRVVKVPDGSPAAQAGLLVGDFIMAIDDRPVAGLSGPQIHALLTGEVGSGVVLRVDRGGSISELRVTRAPYGNK